MTLPSTSRAAVSRGVGHCTVEALPLPDDLCGGALVEVEAAAVCGTDWAHYTDPGFFERGPVVLGHETVGRVVAIDDRYPFDGIALDDRVVVEETVPCGTCADCRDGASHRCTATDFRTPGALRYGRTPIDRAPGLWGGFSEFLYVHPRTGLHRVPDELPPHVAAFSNPVANGLRWIGDVARLRAAESVLVIGPGAHGLGGVLAARALGAGFVAVAGLSDDGVRLADARGLGAELALCSDRDDVVEATAEATGGRGIDVIVDLAPRSATTVDMAVRAAARGARILLAGHKGTDGARLDVDGVLRKEAILLGVRGPSHRSIAAAVDVLMRHREHVGALTTETCPLKDVDHALRLVGREVGPVVSHVIVDPRAPSVDA